MKKPSDTNGRSHIAVLGAGGFVGAHLVQVAARTGTLQTKPILRSYRGLARLGPAATEGRVIDTSNVDVLSQAFHGAQTVVNLTMGDQLRILEDTQVAYQACVKAGVRRLIHMSSAVVFGRVTDSSIHDDSPTARRLGMLYARGKAQAEHWLRERMGREPLRVTVLRPGLIWGPTSNWSEMVGDQLLHGQAVLPRNGAGIANLVFIDNLIRIILAVDAKPEGPSGFYNVADNETVTWQRYYTGLATRLGYPAGAVVLWPDDKLRVGPKHAVEWVLERRGPYMLAKAILKRMSPGMKQMIKAALKAPPEPPGGNGGPPGPPRLSLAHWSLQNTLYRLPASKIHKDFGPLELISFERALDITATWLKFAGFAAPAAVPSRSQAGALAI